MQIFRVLILASDKTIQYGYEIIIRTGITCKKIYFWKLVRLFFVSDFLTKE